MSSMIVGGGIADFIFDDAGGLVVFRSAAAMTFWDSLTGGSQYTGVSYLDGTVAEGGVVPATSDGRVPAVRVDFAGEETPGGAWVSCPGAWTDRRWVAAHGIAATGGGGGGTVFDVIEVTDRIIFRTGDGSNAVWMSANAALYGGAIEVDGISMSNNEGIDWTHMLTTDDAVYTPPSKLLRVIWASDGVSALPGDIGTGRVLYVNPAGGATAPAWLRSGVDLFATNVTV